MGRSLEAPVWESKRRWGWIKKEQGREWKRELVWFLEINKDFLSHTLTRSLLLLCEWMMKGTIPQFRNEQWAPKSLLLHPPYIQWKGWNEGERCDCTLVSAFTKTKRAMWQPWSITVKEVKRGQSCHVDSVGGESGQLQWLHPISPRNKSYFTVTATERRWQKLWLLFIGGPYGKNDNDCHR